MVAFKQAPRGKYDGRLEITFKDASSQSTFIVIRQLRAVVGNTKDYELLKPVAPYVKNRRVEWRNHHEGDVVEGDRPPGLDAVPWVRQLPKAKIPKKLSAILSNGATREVINGIKGSYFPGTMTSLESHTLRFSCLLWVEEARMV